MRRRILTEEDQIRFNIEGKKNPSRLNLHSKLKLLDFSEFQKANLLFSCLTSVLKQDSHSSNIFALPRKAVKLKICHIF